MEKEQPSVEARLAELRETAVCANMSETTLLRNLGYNGVDRGE